MKNSKVNYEDMNKWYEKEVFEKLKDVHIENDKYVIGCFEDCESIRKNLLN